MRNQYHSILLLHRLHSQSSHTPPSALCVSRLRSCKFRICYSCVIHHRHFWPSDPSSRHVPKHGVDPPRSRSMFFDSWNRFLTSRRHRFLHLSFLRILFCRWRPRTFRIQCRSFSPSAERARHGLGCDSVSRFRCSPYHHVPRDGSLHDNHRRIWILRRTEHNGILPHLPLRTWDETTHFGRTRSSV